MARPIPQLLVHANEVPKFLDLIATSSGLSIRALCVELCLRIGAGEPRAFERNWYRWMGRTAAPTLPAATIICAIERVAKEALWISDDLSPEIRSMLECSRDQLATRSTSWNGHSRKRLGREVKQLVKDRLGDHVPMEELVAPLMEHFACALVESTQDWWDKDMPDNGTRFRRAFEAGHKRSSLVIAEFLKRVDDFEKRCALPTENEAAEMLEQLQNQEPIRKLMENPISILTGRRMSGAGTEDPSPPVVGT